MPHNKEPIAHAPILRILKEAGIRRVSKDALQAISNAIEQESEDIAKKAVNLAEHAGRTTILLRDIELARRK